MVKTKHKARPLWMPKSIVKLAQRGKLHWNEAVLLSRIKLLDKTHAGCFASNTYLRRDVGVSLSRLHAMLRKFKDMGLIHVQISIKRKIVCLLD